MAQDSLITVEHLSRRYGEQVAVNDLSFSVARGEVLGFLGPNGAGKSTTMQMLTGNLAPGTGRITINGIDLLEQPREAKRHLGYLPEQPPLYRDLTVDEYLRLCARLHHIPRSHLGAAVDDAKGRCGLGEVGRRLIGHLSKGYQQRVGIAQAIIHNPAVVILDEPTVGLDPIQIREIRHLVRELGGEHSVILSTHILPEVQATCDRVQIIQRGQLVLSDSIAGIRQRMRGGSLLLGLQHPPGEAALLAIPGVQGVETLEPQRLRIRYDSEASTAQGPAEALAQAAVEQGWGLFELSPEQRSLEEIFVDLTTRDDAPQPGKAA